MEEFKRVLEDYIKEPTDYAIMLNGKWGTGKTYYVKNTIIPYLKELKKKGSSKSVIPEHFIHISLYGVTTTNEIGQKIFGAINPTIAKLKEAAKYFSIPKSPISLTNILSAGYFINEALPKTLIFFDDLERAGEQIIDFMGYINDLIENHKLKAIILCDEEQIAKDVKVEYLKKKEKTIRYTHEYNAGTEDFFNSYLKSKLRLEDSFKSFIEKVILPHEEFHKEKSLHNLRILSGVMDSFNLFFKEIENSGKKIDHLNRGVEAFFFLFLMHANLIQNASFRKEFEIFKKEEERTTGNLIADLEIDCLEGEIDALREVDEEYFELAYLKKQFEEKFYTLTLFPQELKRYIKTRQLVIEAVESKLLHPQLTENIFENIIVGFWKHNDDEVREALDKVLSEISNGTYGLSSLFHIGASSLCLIDSEIHVDRAKIVIQKIKAHLPETLKSMKYTVSFRKDIEYSIHAPYIFKSSAIKEEYKEYKKYFMDTIKKYRKSRVQILEPLSLLW